MNEFFDEESPFKKMTSGKKNTNFEINFEKDEEKVEKSY
jgi:hypothetical protein